MGHEDVLVLVHASTMEAAKETAEEVYNSLIDDGDTSYDYYDDDSIKVYPATSPEGEGLIRERLTDQLQTHLHHLKRIRQRMANATDEALLADDMARFSMHQVGAYRGMEVFLYDADGHGIRTESDLEEVTSESSENPLWVVVADMHH